MVAQVKSRGRHRASGRRRSGANMAGSRQSVSKSRKSASRLKHSVRQHERVPVVPRAGRGKRGEAHTALMLATRTRSKAAGLLFRSPNDKALLLVSCNDVHTVGMRHAIDVAFVNYQGKVLEAHRSVGPLRRLRNPKAVAVVERFSSCDAPWFAKGDQVMISTGRETIQ